MVKKKTYVDLLTTLERLTGLKWYFNPPAKGMKYPCGILQYDNDKDEYADGLHYTSRKRYTATIIDLEPDSEYGDLLKQLPYTSMDRHYAADNLHHFVYTIYQ